MENNNQRKELKVSAIENGTVIDHIPAQSVFRVIRILGLEKMDNQVLFGTNLDRVSNKFFKSEEINKIALVAPSATLIVIKNYKVVQKDNVEIPDYIEKIAKCFNPNCITNHENVATKFDVIKDEETLKLSCRYCEKTTSKENLVFF